MTKTQFIKSLIITVDAKSFQSSWFAPAGLLRGKIDVISLGDGVGKSVFGRINN